MKYFKSNAPSFLVNLLHHYIQIIQVNAPSILLSFQAADHKI